MTQVLSLSIACFNIFLIPLDVGNQGDSAAVDGQGGLPMAKITVAFYTMTMILTLAVVPFTVFFYEGDDEKDRGDGSR